MPQGHIRPQGEGSWEIKFDLGRDPLTGRRTTKYVTFRGTKRKAQEELTRLLGQRNEGSYIEPTKWRSIFTIGSKPILIVVSLPKRPHGIGGSLRRTSFLGSAKC
jgi:hypothetical protein